MTTLLTGGLGARTAVSVAKNLQAASSPFIFASRRGPEVLKEVPSMPSTWPVVKFDFFDPATYSAPFDHPAGQDINQVFLVMPPVLKADINVNNFVDYAVDERGVRRFVLMAGTSAQLDAPGAGRVWRKLVQKGVEFVVCRPTWFMQNFTEWFHFKSITEQDKIFTACGDAKVPFISVDDIAAVTTKLILSPELPNADVRLTGPELLSHDEVAAVLTDVIGRPVENVKLKPDARKQQLQDAGFDMGGAAFFVFLEGLVKKGDEEVLEDAVEKYTGHKGVTFRDFCVAHKDAWVKK